MKASRLFAALAALFALAFLACHLLGLREHVSVLSGTAPPGGADSAPLGALYAIAWFAGVIAAPILALAAGISAALERLR